MHTILAAPQPQQPTLAPKISLDYMMFAHEVRQPCYNSSGAIFLSAFLALDRISTSIEKVRKSVQKVRRT
jgi:hypothetical protein